MKKLLSLLMILCFLSGICAAEEEIYVQYVYNDFFVYDVGTQTVVNGKLVRDPGIGYPIKAELRDEEGTVLASREFEKYGVQRSFVFNVPKDWEAGLHRLAIYAGDKKLSGDFMLFVKEHEKVVKRIDTEEKKIVISIDCGAGGSVGAAKWIKLLQKYNGRATFFLTGRWAEEHPDAVKAIHEAGYEIGNHSYNHPHMEKVTSWKTMEYEIMHTNEVIYDLVGVTPRFFRVPYGDWSYSLITICHALGFDDSIQWTISSGDSAAGISGNEILRKATPTNIEPGSIVLFHCGNPAVELMDKAFDYYVNTLGYELAALGDIYPEGDSYVDDNFVLHVK